MATAEKPVLSKYKDRMDKAILALKDEFATLRTGRASSGLLDQVMVEAYGSTVPINQVGAVSFQQPGQGALAAANAAGDTQPPGRAGRGHGFHRPMAVSMAGGPNTIAVRPASARNGPKGT